MEDSVTNTVTKMATTAVYLPHLVWSEACLRLRLPVGRESMTQAFSANYAISLGSVRFQLDLDISSTLQSNALTRERVNPLKRVNSLTYWGFVEPTDLE